MKKKKVIVESRDSEYERILNTFLSNIGNIKKTVPLVFTLLVEECERVQNFVFDFLTSEENKFRELNKKLKGLKDKPEELKFKEIKSLVNMVYVQRVNSMKEKLSNDLSESLLATEVVPASLFVSLINLFEDFILKLIRETFKLEPAILRSQEKSYSYSAISKFKSQKSFEEFLIEREVENIMLKSHSQRFDWIEERLNKKFIKKLKTWPEFIEVTERRNLLVHNDGKVTEEYLKVCKENRVRFKEKINTGEVLAPNPQYVRKAHDCLYEMAVIVVQELWRKYLKTNIKSADYSLDMICDNLISSEEFVLADRILDYATEKIEKYSTEEIENSFIINRALSKKLNGKSQAAEKIIGEKDWSSSSLKFQLSNKIILGKFDDAARIMKRIGKKGEISQDNYIEWPLFKKFRQSPKFKKTYKEIFEVDFLETQDPLKILNEEEYEFLNSIRDIILNKSFSDKELEKLLDIL